MGKRNGEGYGLVTLMCAVIGTVIGSGIFFKSEEILNLTNGNALVGLLALTVGGGVMILCASAFAGMSGECGSEWGIVGYAEKKCGVGFARFTAVFSAFFYLPSMTATLAWVSAEYFSSVVGAKGDPAVRIASAGLFLVAFFAVNTIAPRAAGAFQIVSTAVKLLPILAVGAVGTVMLATERTVNASPDTAGGGFMPALLSAAFAYEGWIAVTALGGEARDGKRDLPRALFFGSLTVLFVYLLYYVGVLGASGGDTETAFSTIFGSMGGKLMLIFVTLSCLGALNGLTMSTVRGHYVLSKCLDNGDGTLVFSEVSVKNGIPVMSGVMGLFVSELWLLCLFCADNGLLDLGFDPAEASISLMYAIYVPIFISAAKNQRASVLAALAAVASLLIVAAAPISFGISSLTYLAAVIATSVPVLAVRKSVGRK